MDDDDDDGALERGVEEEGTIELITDNDDDGISVDKLLVVG